MRTVKPRLVVATALTLGLITAGLTTVLAAPTSWAFDELHPQSQLQGSWAARVLPNAYAGQVAASRNAGDKLTVRFNGDRITVLGMTDRFSGRAAFSVDGSKESIVDFYTSSTVYRAPIFTAGGLSSGAHSVTIRVTGDQNPRSRFAFVSIDGFIVGSRPGACVANGIDRTITGSEHNDVLCGSNRNDEMYGLGGDDSLSGGIGADRIDGGPGNDAHDGGAGTDDCTDNSGSNTWINCEIPDSGSGGGGGSGGGSGGGGGTGGGGGSSPGLPPPPSGRPTLAPLANPTPTPVDCRVSGATNLIGSEGDDILCGTEGDDVIDGLGGNDIIIGRGGNDLLIGGAGDDTISGGEGSDAIAGGDGNDTVTGDQGDDSLVGEDGNDSLDGGEGHDTCVDEIGTNTITACEVPLPTPGPSTPPSSAPGRPVSGTIPPTAAPTASPSPTPTPAKVVEEIDDTDARVAVFGKYSKRTHSDARFGSWQISRIANDHIDLDFTGSSVSIYTGRDRFSGKARILIDGRFMAELDLYSPSAQYGVLVATIDGLSPGRHRISFVTTGESNPSARYAFAGVDSFVVTS